MNVFEFMEFLPRTCSLTRATFAFEDSQRNVLLEGPDFIPLHHATGKVTLTTTRQCAGRTKPCTASVVVLGYPFSYSIVNTVLNTGAGKKMCLLCCKQIPGTNLRLLVKIQSLFEIKIFRLGVRVLNRCASELKAKDPEP